MTIFRRFFISQILIVLLKSCSYSLVNATGVFVKESSHANGFLKVGNDYVVLHCHIKDQQTLECWITGNPGITIDFNDKAYTEKTHISLTLNEPIIIPGSNGLAIFQILHRYPFILDVSYKNSEGFGGLVQLFATSKMSFRYNQLVEVDSLDGQYCSAPKDSTINATLKILSHFNLLSPEQKIVLIRALIEVNGVDDESRQTCESDFVLMRTTGDIHPLNRTIACGHSGPGNHMLRVMGSTKNATGVDGLSLFSQVYFIRQYMVLEFTKANCGS